MTALTAADLGMATPRRRAATISAWLTRVERACRSLPAPDFPGFLLLFLGKPMKDVRAGVKVFRAVLVPRADPRCLTKSSTPDSRCTIVRPKSLRKTAVIDVLAVVAASISAAMCCAGTSSGRDRDSRAKRMPAA